jgi:hypothetical protein
VTLWATCYIASLTRADAETLSAALLKGRQGGWLSASDCRDQTGFEAVPDGDDIAPPVSGGQPAKTTCRRQRRRPTILLRWRCLTSIEGRHA